MSRVDARHELQTLAARIQSARQALQIYPPRHPQLDQALEECFAKLLELLGNDPRIQIALADREFVLGNMQVPAPRPPVLGSRRAPRAPRLGPGAAAGHETKAAWPGSRSASGSAGPQADTGR